MISPAKKWLRRADKTHPIMGATCMTCLKPIRLGRLPVAHCPCGSTMHIDELFNAHGLGAIQDDYVSNATSYVVGDEVMS